MESKLEWQNARSRVFIGKKTIQDLFRQSVNRKYRCEGIKESEHQNRTKVGTLKHYALRTLKIYLEGNSLRGIGRILKVTHQSVSI